MNQKSDGFFINNNRYASYYTEKDISFVLTEDHRLVENTDEISEISSGLTRCYRITCNTVEEFKKYSISERIYNVGPVEQLTAYVFINMEDDMLEGYAMVQGTERIHIIETISAQLRSDILEFLMITYPLVNFRSDLY
ncbi:hypothetical protein [Lacrimispora sp.]|uniref:hypothetical protein n=1 Tax=Lacrimispora sp. TaxID=2719234 RepID=UPI002899D1A7|nr:hypothetical protein [Lacrimispora sp.]